MCIQSAQQSISQQPSNLFVLLFSSDGVCQEWHVHLVGCVSGVSLTSKVTALIYAATGLTVEVSVESFEFILQLVRPSFTPGLQAVELIPHHTYWQ